jgi:putative restriction endonuclease
LQLSVAWNIFGEHNGAESFEEFSNSIRGYMNHERAQTSDPQIGCIVLTQPFFWPKSSWMPPPADWSPNIVRGKRYSTDTEHGRLLYAAVQERLQAPFAQEMTLQENRFGAPILIQPRLGQAGFRYAVIERYERGCAMTGERSLPALEAAHIRPYRKDGPHLVSNGLLLRADLHRLFVRVIRVENGC